MKRFIHNDNGSLLDYSTNLVDYNSSSATLDIVSAEDSIYIGSEYPFNSLFFDMGTVNDQVSSLTIQYWDGGAWRNMVDVQDETNSLFNSGHITWSTNKSNNWAKEDTVYTTGGEQITGLGSVTIYDLYWLKITFSADLNAATSLSFIGSKFCEDSDLTGEYPLFGKSGFIDAYESGKTTWEREIVLASRLVIEELQSKAAIFSGDQLLKRREFTNACVSKAAELIFNGMGDDYDDDRIKARAEFKSRINKKNYGADLNNNARLDEFEKGVVTGVLHR